MIDRAKKQWDDTYKTRPMVAAVDFAKSAYKHLRSIPHCTLLDIGCGDGRDAIYFAKQGINVTAIDFSEEAIKRLKAVAPEITASVQDIERLDFPDASFEALYAHLSLHYFDDTTTRSIVTRIDRMLKPGGYVFIRCKSIHDPLYGKGERKGDHMFVDRHLRHFFSVTYMRSILSNFDILSIGESSASYDGKVSCFIDAIAKKAM